MKREISHQHYIERAEFDHTELEVSSSKLFPNPNVHLRVFIVWMKQELLVERIFPDEQFIEHAVNPIL